MFGLSLSSRMKCRLSTSVAKWNCECFGPSQLLRTTVDAAAPQFWPKCHFRILCRDSRLGSTLDNWCKKSRSC